MNDAKLLSLVDTQDLRELFIAELGWNNPDQPERHFEVADQTYTLTQIAGYKGLRIWFCAELPARKVQRLLDELIGQDSHERLVIFADDRRQEWRWPRRAQLGAANAKLLVHRHVIGEPDPHMARQLSTIAIDFDDDISLVELLNKMRLAFDAEAEAASVQAARLMGTLYSELDAAGATPHDATLLLARLLFLLFGDDSDMWRAGLFGTYLETQTSAESLAFDLAELFEVLNTEKRPLEGRPDLNEFRYINGGIFADALSIVPLTASFREALLSACEFDWAIISPAVFGSMFQTVKDRQARRHGGEHYTTEENILKTIGPLFLDEVAARLEAGWNDKAQLTRLHNDLGKLRFLDPACGCGNFLIVAYRELRALELRLLTRRRDLDLLDGVHGGKINRFQLSFDVTGDIKVTLDHFFGIEIEEWPARIAATAMLLVDHLANQRMEQDFGNAPDRLPIKIAPTILHDNALIVDWASLVPPSEDVIILGNPPFIGQYTKTPAQTAEAKAIWGARYNGYLDYVTSWYAKAIDYYGDTAGRWAFVSTNSISQGEPVEFLWRPILEAGWRCRFAHRSFQWLTEAPGGAAVHVSIIGFDRASSPRPILWTYPEGGKGEGFGRPVTRINPYLIDAPNVLVSNRTKPMSPSLPAVIYGSKPTDGQNLLVSASEIDAVREDAIAAKYLRRFIGARELLHDTPRWCLWLVDAGHDDIENSPVLSARVAAVEELRRGSTDAGTNKAAAWPHRFQYVRQPQSSYLAIPAHVGESRKFFTAARYESDVICGNANFVVADPDGFALGLISSSMFIAWMRAIGGRLKSDLRFSNTFTYNSFPIPALSAGQRGQIVTAAKHLVDVRASYPGVPLAELYEGKMAPDLADAHSDIDRAVDRIFNVGAGADVEQRQKVLLRHYAKITGQETLFEI
jgi:hypothetical protein